MRVLAGKKGSGSDQEICVKKRVSGSYFCNVILVELWVLQALKIIFYGFIVYVNEGVSGTKCPETKFFYMTRWFIWNNL